ncbi:MAG: tetratricopeptide repeat protein [Nitrosomonadales bacterium]|nr:tetratricopeptide repeat protein [Nitrosomonadales bacterium]
MNSFSIPQAFQTALGHYQAGQVPQAVAVFRQILQTEPNHADALHFLGVIALQSGNHDGATDLIGKAIGVKPTGLMHYNLGLALRAQGKLDEAAASYRKATALQPDYAEAHFNLGNVLQKQGKLDEAIASYRKVLALKPDWVDAHNNLGSALQEQGKLDGAIASYRRAIALKPGFANAHNNLGIALQKQGKPDEATVSYRKAISLKPDYADAHKNLGSVFQDQGRLDQAMECYRKAISLDPKNESVSHLISALAAQTTERAPSQYVEKLFDGYANTFDTHLVQGLSYKMPSELLALLKQVADLPAGKWDVLDLGCGTGLAGQEISPHARQLVGVDLSANMLERARARNVYHRLAHSDLLPMMRGEEPSNYDLIIAADVFVYLGRLDEIVSEAGRLLRAGGYFMFSVEALGALPGDAGGAEGETGYKLNPSGRYAHQAGYLEKLAAANGFRSLRMISTPVRLEKGVQIPAWAAVWQNSN